MCWGVCTLQHKLFDLGVLSELSYSFVFGKFMVCFDVVVDALNRPGGTILSTWALVKGLGPAAADPSKLEIRLKPVVHHQFLLLQIMFTNMFTFTFWQPGRLGQ